MNDQTTDQQLNDLETLAKNIPGGPWTVDDSRAELRGSHGNLLADLWDDRLGAYFVAMHAATQPLVAEVRRLRARVTDLERPAVGPDTLPAWLRQRFTASGVNWEHLDDTERSYWEHQARAVRRAVARNGFKTAEETHVVADGSDDPEHIDGCPGCEARPVPAASEEQR